MLKSIRYRNFKILRNATLPLSPLTLIIGANGSGKSTAIEGLILLGKRPKDRSYSSLASVGVNDEAVKIAAEWAQPSGVFSSVEWGFNGGFASTHQLDGRQVSDAVAGQRELWLSKARAYSLVPEMLVEPSRLLKRHEFGGRGENLAGVLDVLRDQAPEKFEELNRAIASLIPDFDRVLFDVPKDDHRAFMLRTASGQHPIAAKNLSQGTLLSVAILTLAYLPNPPTCIAIEEPERGIHPRLFRHVIDALFRLAYPKDHGENRDPVQVIATTHSPYFLDLFKEFPEHVVVAEKKGLTAEFHSLNERNDLEEILERNLLGDAWYSGFLGGVPIPS